MLPSDIDTLKNRLIFTGLLESLTRSGMPFPAAVAYAGGKISGKVRSICSAIHARLQQGVSVSESFGEYPEFFPEYYVRVLSSGETGGELLPALQSLKKLENREFTTRKRINSATVYPRVLLMLSLVILYFFLFYLLPKFDQVSQLVGGLDKSHFHSSIVMETINFFTVLSGARTEILFFLLIIMLATVISLRSGLFSGLRNWLRYNMPITGTIRRLGDFTLFFESLGVLLSNGTPLDRAWAVSTRTMGDDDIRDNLSRVAVSLNKGDSLVPLLETVDWPTSYIASAMKSGELRGNVEETCFELVTYLDKIISHKTQVSLYIVPFIFMIIPVLIIIFCFVYLLGLIKFLAGS